MTPAAPERTPIVRTFMTHDMRDEEIDALFTGRDQALERVATAIARSLSVVPGSLQHVVLYGSRGFGKSFMTRRIQTEVARNPAAARVQYVLLPEEQHNLHRSPHALLDTIAARLEDVPGSDEAFRTTAFQWPRPGEEARRWDEAAARLDAALARVLPPDGMAIVAIENFDILLATLFEGHEDEQRLRLWLGRPDNRLMLIATATGTVNLDYDRPLFQAFESLWLPPWSTDECIAYFSRKRALEGRRPLDAREEAKARAVAEFIGGTPRLAQLLSDVIDTGDALSVAETMSALADRLAEYYRRRIEDLSPLAAGLLDALIRGGEPASQTTLAERVGADGQSTIARVMTDLQRADIIRGRPALDSRETLYRVTDRIFVHYYRLRQGSGVARDTPLATILEFLERFYSRDEKRQEAMRHLNAGRPAEARLFSQLARGEWVWDTGYARSFYSRLIDIVEALPKSGMGPVVKAAVALDDDPTQAAFDAERAIADAPVAVVTVARLVRAQGLHRMDVMPEEVPQELDRALEAAGDDRLFQLAARLEQAMFVANVKKDERAALALYRGMEPLLDDLPPSALVVACGAQVAWSYLMEDEDEQANAASTRAVAAARALERPEVLARTLAVHAGYEIIVDRVEPGLEAAGESLALVDADNDRATAFRAGMLQARALLMLDRGDEALASARLVLERAAGDPDWLAQASDVLAKALADIDDMDELAGVAQRGAVFAEQAGNPKLQTELLRWWAAALSKTGSPEEALTAARRSETVARGIDAADELAEALRWRAVSEFELERPADAWDTALELITVADAVDEQLLRRVGFHVAIGAAGQIARPKAMELFARWLTTWREKPGDDAQGHPLYSISDAASAAALAGNWVAFDDALPIMLTMAADLSFHPPFVQEDGLVLARIAARDGRAAAFDAAAAMIARIGRVMAAVPEAVRDDTWLPAILLGYARVCDDPGSLRDMIGLIVAEHGEEGRVTADILRLIADIEEGGEAETVLSRVDPDVATLIRRLRNLPDPSTPAPHRRGRAKRVKPR